MAMGAGSCMFKQSRLDCCHKVVRLEMKWIFETTVKSSSRLLSRGGPICPYPGCAPTKLRTHNPTADRRHWLEVHAWLVKHSAAYAPQRLRRLVVVAASSPLRRADVAPRCRRASLFPCLASHCWRLLLPGDSIDSQLVVERLLQS